MNTLKFIVVFVFLSFSNMAIGQYSKTKIDGSEPFEITYKNLDTSVPLKRDDLNISY